MSRNRTATLRAVVLFEFRLRMISDVDDEGRLSTGKTLQAIAIPFFVQRVLFEVEGGLLANLESRTWPWLPPPTGPCFGPPHLGARLAG